MNHVAQYKTSGGENSPAEVPVCVKCLKPFLTPMSVHREDGVGTTKITVHICTRANMDSKIMALHNLACAGTGTALERKNMRF